MKNKKTLIIVAIAILVLSGLAALIFTKERPGEEETTVVKKKISQPVNIIPVSERPYMRLIPSADGHYITLNVVEIKKAATNLDYEMEYQTGSMLQGFQGVLSLARLPAADKKLFGSQSAGGAITYHEDISGGNLLAEFDGGSEPYAVKSAWNYVVNSEDEMQFSSKDELFTIENASLANYSYIVIYNSPGYPGELESEPISEIYTISAEKSLKTISSNFSVSFTTEAVSAQIMGYDGESWQSLETTLTNGVATASDVLMESYLLIAN